MGAFMALPVAALVTSFVSNYGRHNEVVYEFDYNNHSEAPLTAEDRERLEGAQSGEGGGVTP
jgi:hypothetical protein